MLSESTNIHIDCSYWYWLLSFLLFFCTSCVLTAWYSGMWVSRPGIGLETDQDHFFEVLVLVLVLVSVLVSACLVIGLGLGGWSWARPELLHRTAGRCFTKFTACTTKEEAYLAIFLRHIIHNCYNDWWFSTCSWPTLILCPVARPLPWRRLQIKISSKPYINCLNVYFAHQRRLLPWNVCLAMGWGYLWNLTEPGWETRFCLI